jgi:hypothetical protein
MDIKGWVAGNIKVWSLVLMGALGWDNRAGLCDGLNGEIRPCGWLHETQFEVLNGLMHDRECYWRQIYHVMQWLIYGYWGASSSGSARSHCWHCLAMCG